MDTRRGERSEPDPHGSSQAEVSDLATRNLDSGPPRRPWTLIVAGAAVIALVSFALGAKSASPAALTGSPNAFATAPLDSLVAATPPSVTFGIEPTGLASPASPTPGRPTFPPAGAWFRAPLLQDEDLDVDGVWGVDGRIVVLAHYSHRSGSGQSLVMVSLEPGRAWRSLDVPSPIGLLAGGTVVDDQLWFLASVDGIAPEDRSWTLVSTDSGESWAASPAASGLGPVQRESLLGRVGSTWVASPDRFAEDETSNVRLVRSSDGVRWTEVELPDVGNVLSYDQIATIGDRMLLLLTAGSPDSPVHVLLSSTDGSAWRPEAFPATLDDPFDLACSDTTCVLTGFEFDVPAMPVAWVSSDGRTWRESTTTLPAGESHSGIFRVISTPAGFLGIEGYPRDAWRSSPDGMTWQSLDVLPRDNQDDFVDLAVAGDVVIGLVYGNGDDQPPGVWRGSVSLLDR